MTTAQGWNKDDWNTFNELRAKANYEQHVLATDIMVADRVRLSKARIRAVYYEVQK